MIITPIKENTETVVEVSSSTDITGEPHVTRKPSLADILRLEINDTISISQDLSNKVKTAKTKPKRDLYIKKLQKNNQIVFELLVSLQRLTINKSNAK